MFESIPDNCDRELVKEMFWYCVANNDTADLWERFKASTVINPSYPVNQFLKDVLALYRRYHADSNFSIPFNAQLVIAVLVFQASVNPDKFGL